MARRGRPSIVADRSYLAYWLTKQIHDTYGPLPRITRDTGEWPVATRETIQMAGICRLVDACFEDLRNAWKLGRCPHRVPERCWNRAQAVRAMIAEHMGLTLEELAALEHRALVLRNNLMERF